DAGFSLHHIQPALKFDDFRRDVRDGIGLLRRIGEHFLRRHQDHWVSKVRLAANINGLLVFRISYLNEASIAAQVNPGLVPPHAIGSWHQKASSPWIALHISECDPIRSRFVADDHGILTFFDANALIVWSKRPSEAMRVHSLRFDIPSANRRGRPGSRHHLLPAQLSSYHPRLTDH